MNKGLYLLLIGGLAASAVAAFVASPPPTSTSSADSTGSPGGSIAIAPHDDGTSHIGQPGLPSESFAEEPLPPGHPAIGDKASEGSEEPLPPGHPPIGAAATTGATLDEDNDNEPPQALVTWKAPDTWRKVPNPNTIRIATYRCPGATAGAEEAELAVSTAGGTAESNIERWVGQFAPQGRVVRQEQREAAGFHVRIVQIRGSYLAGAMGGGGGDDVTRPGLGLLGAVVETPQALTFFKMVGPASAVEVQRGQFDALIKSLARR